ncbi:hypothetical protein DL93DRAFT_2124861 [Clavulina sp. PMI_390]|nr:hypothetical protein DL93DRAFT_2124861 [Clavulina sp. PMI_390]
MLPPTRRALSGPAARGIVRVVRRRLATEAPKSAEEAALNTTPPPRKRRGFLTSTLLYSTVFGTTFYAGSTLISLHDPRYHDFFVESVPFGETIMDYADSQGWDQIQATRIPKEVKDVATGAYRSMSAAVARTMGNAPTLPTVEAVKDSAKSATESTKKAVSSGITFVQKKAEETQVKAAEVAHDAKDKTLHFTKDVQDLVTEAEKALAPAAAPASEEAKPDVPKVLASAVEAVKAVEAPSPSPSPFNKSVYPAALPLGFEPPPGYSRPAPPKQPSGLSKSDKAPKSLPPSPPLPLVAPAVKELSASEPVIAQIASSIDGLATLLKDSPTSAAGAKDILDTAQIDLVQLGSRIEVIKKEEQAKLEAQLDEQAKEYSLKVLQLEVDAQDKMDAQEEGFKAMLEDERQQILALYRQKLANELETQSEIINQRLKEEVIAQGIEMQRRWIREIKVRVEQERGGRLAKLSELASGLKKLERVTLDNSSYLDENLRLHTLWSALRAFTNALDSPTRRPFREELRVLRHVAAAKEDPLIAAALESIDKSETPDVGVEPLGDLVTWFVESVGPRVEAVALVPDQDAGVLSHLASSALSHLRFKRQGLVDGEDVLSVVARAEHHLAEKDLDSAARELNQLKGVPKVLLADWLAATRKRLEVEQALEVRSESSTSIALPSHQSSVIRSQATLSSLLVV